MKFSIVTISYNSEKAIERTIKSVLGQTYKDFEYIIIDGASKDGTLNIVKRYEPLFDGRMKWQSEPDKGIYNAMNKGVMMASGDMIGIVNSDDWLEPDTLQYVSDVIEQEGLDFKGPLLITGWINYHYQDGELVVMKSNRERYEYYAKKLRMGLNHPATFVSKATYDIIGLFDENYKLFGDADFIVRCYRSTTPIFFVDRVLSNMSDGGASSTISKKAFRDSWYRIEKYYTSNRLYQYVYKLRIIFFYVQSLLVPRPILRLIRKTRNS